MTLELTSKSLRLLARLRDREPIETLAPEILRLDPPQRRRFAVEAMSILTVELDSEDGCRMQQAIVTWAWLRDEAVMK